MRFWNIFSFGDGRQWKLVKDVTGKFGELQQQQQPQGSTKRYLPNHHRDTSARQGMVTTTTKAKALVSVADVSCLWRCDLSGPSAHRTHTEIETCTYHGGVMTPLFKVIQD